MRLRVTLMTSLLALLPALSVQAEDSATLTALRADLSSGSLRPLLDRQRIIEIPDALQEQWLADSPFRSFAVTGFNENGQRFAARIRLHLISDDHEDALPTVTFIRVSGTPGSSYRIDQFHDYASGLDLAALEAEKAWLLSGEGKAFLAMLSQQPDNTALAPLARGRPAALALWLAQCMGRPCENTALTAQIPTDSPAFSHVQRGFMAGDQEQAADSIVELHRALGDDPWLWRTLGLQAHQYGHCQWVLDEMQRGWMEHPDNTPLADTTLQCTLATLDPEQQELDDQGTAFMQRLSQQIGRDNLARAISEYYRQYPHPQPAALQAWTAASRKE